jgi:superfamily I DNA and RNA helicase
MSLDVLITTSRIETDHVGRTFIQFVNENQQRLGLEDAVLYYDFPSYVDYETALHKPDTVIVSPTLGIIVVNFLAGRHIDAERPEQPSEEVEEFCSLLIARLLKSKTLRVGVAGLAFNVIPLIIALDAQDAQQYASPMCESLTSMDGFERWLAGQQRRLLTDSQMAEVRSVIEGAKALTRPQRRQIDRPAEQTVAVALARLEAEIANFDERQRRTALVTIHGPQRIRGLAGSGKTVILAMKAAHLHLVNPDANILVTFFTKSLRGTIRGLISRFYRHWKDEDPDWKRLQIRHGWGGRNLNGVYADSCRRAQLTPLTFSEAKRGAGTGDAFEYACRDLLSRNVVEPFFDHILIDEGQDFPTGFYELCFLLARGPRDEKNIVWAYDELQNILNVVIRSPQQLFGLDTDGQPRVSLERVTNLPPGANNDVVLSKCYRNQREILVAAHALGFGIYGEIVQLLESPDHWRDVGYDVPGDTFAVDEPVHIVRPAENSPLSITKIDEHPLIVPASFDSLAHEVGWAADEISAFLAAGLQPEDVMVIALDDSAARTYLSELAEVLVARGISCNNVIADPYGDPPFVIPNSVTLSTVYRAKGNEAALVVALGIDAINGRTRSGRNKIFTAFTRSKAWLRVSGIGTAADRFFGELAAALNNFPALDFIMPDLQRVNLIQRDLSAKAEAAKRLRDEYLRKAKIAGLSDEEALDLFTEGGLPK